MVPLPAVPAVVLDPAEPPDELVPPGGAGTFHSLSVVEEQAASNPTVEPKAAKTRKARRMSIFMSGLPRTDRASCDIRSKLAQSRSG
jgi:hypothetical protein